MPHSMIFELLIDSGQDSLMTVVGTALLDNVGLNHIQELCVQKKAPLIAEEAMTEIITVNTLQFVFVLILYLSHRHLFINLNSRLEYRGRNVMRDKRQNA
jgi:hypothetical protein